MSACACIERCSREQLNVQLSYKLLWHSRLTCCQLAGRSLLPRALVVCHSWINATATPALLSRHCWMRLLLFVICLLLIWPPRNVVGHASFMLACTGVKFFEEVTVTDPDTTEKAYLFSVTDVEHCACFNIGEGSDGSPLISWSDLVSLYSLPDGSKWAEHGSLYDAEDLVPPASPACSTPAALLVHHTDGVGFLPTSPHTLQCSSSSTSRALKLLVVCCAFCVDVHLWPPAAPDDRLLMVLTQFDTADYAALHWHCTAVMASSGTIAAIDGQCGCSHLFIFPHHFTPAYPAVGGACCQSGQGSHSLAGQGSCAARALQEGGQVPQSVAKY